MSSYPKTYEEAAVANAEIDRRRKAGEITPREAKRQKRLNDVAAEAYQTSAAKGRFMGGKSAS